MCDKSSTSNLVVGLGLGAALGAGMAFLFGTKKGKQLRNQVVENYPELFDNLQDTLGQLKESLGEKYEEVAQQVEEVKESLEETGNEKAAEIKDIVSDKVAQLGVQMEDLGKKIQSFPPTPVKRRFFKRN